MRNWREWREMRNGLMGRDEDSYRNGSHSQYRLKDGGVIAEVELFTDYENADVWPTLVDWLGVGDKEEYEELLDKLEELFDGSAGFKVKLK